MIPVHIQQRDEFIRRHVLHSVPYAFSQGLIPLKERMAKETCQTKRPVLHLNYGKKREALEKL